MANDDDLIHRGDALAIVERGDFVYHNIAALPAVTPAPDAEVTPPEVLDALRRLQQAADVLADPTAVALVRREDLLAVIDALEPVTQPAPDAAAIREAALREAHDAIADYPRVSPDSTEAQHYDEQIEHCQSIILALITEKPHDRA